ncbi:hypothetical protein GQ457_09G021540 [Hibiscus cannabinus]
MDDILDVGCLVLVTMTPELHKKHEYMVAYEMIQNLKEILKGKHKIEDALKSVGEISKEGKCFHCDEPRHLKRKLHILS